MGNLLHLTTEDMTGEALAKQGTILVDFWAAWCAPCRTIAPAVEKLADAFAGRAKVGKVNVDESADAAAQYGVASIPTIIVFKDGREAERMVGVQSSKALTDLLERNL